MTDAAKTAAFRRLLDGHLRYVYPAMARVAGSLAIEGRYVVGTAADGAVVRIAYLDDLSVAETYLATHPTPENW